MVIIQTDDDRNDDDDYDNRNDDRKNDNHDDDNAFINIYRVDHTVPTSFLD